METSILETTLTDGSIVYSVIFVDGAQKGVIAANDKKSAHIIQKTLARHAFYATIEPL